MAHFDPVPFHLVDKSAQVHPSSFIDEPCVIGENTVIWHFCHIMAGCRIGRACRVGQNVVISPGVVVGNNVKIQNNVSLYSGVTLEDDVFCGPSVVFTNVLTPRSAFPRNRVEDALPTLVKQGASLGANATVVCGHTIGAHALVGAGAVVTRDVPDYAIFYGNPARLRGWACQCGARLDFDSSADEDVEIARCRECERAYSLEKNSVALLSGEVSGP